MEVIDVNSGSTLDDVSMEKAEQFSNLSWSPNGKDIVFTGLSEGQSDLYSYNFDTKKITQLTNDKYTDYQPTYSRDGKKIIFSSDRSTYDQSLEQAITFNLAELDLASGKVTDIKIFNGANNLNPQYSADGTQIYFLSNRDGFRNMYRYTMSTGQLEQMTDLFTGICGITEFSPALSISANDDVVYSYYRAQKYALYNAKASAFKPVTLQAQAVDFSAAMLPPSRAVGVDLINSNLNNFLAYKKIPTDSVKEIAYHPKFKLDYLAGSGIGVGVSSFYGTSLSSGIQGVFSDILGRNQIFAAASVNGQIYDSGAAVTYVNQTGRWNLGTGISHIPYLFGLQTQTFPKQNVGGKNVTVLSQNTDIIRNFEDAARVFTSYPINKTTRFEVSGGASYNSYRVDRYSTVYKLDTVINADKSQTISTTPISSGKDKIPKSEESALLNYNLKSYSLLQLSTALVGDNSFFGVTAPLNGFRYRLEAGYNFGTYHFFSPTIDLRKYVRVEPVTFAARFFGYGRFGDSNGIYPLFIGYPFYIRGYEGQTFYNNNKKSSNGFNIDQLSGSRMAVFNFETRLPFTGPEKLAQIKSKFLFTDLNLFFDAGLAWNAGDHIYFQKNPPVLGQTPALDADGNQQVDGSGNPVFNKTYGRVPAVSAGISLRINVFGAFVLEPYLAIPFNRTDVSKPVFGLGFTPGW